MERIQASPTPRFASPAVRAMAESIPEVEHYELDGIPLFHLPASGPTTLSLSFAVGPAYEPVTRRGVTHLAEHLLLNSIDGALDHSNGATEPFRLTFITRGSATDASSFLRDVCASIAHPRLSRMYEEAHVLRSEASVRGSPGPVLTMYWLRTGNQGCGATFLPEFFLRHLDEAIIRDWIGRNLVAGNAAILVAGSLPDDLYVALEPGPRIPPPAYAEIEGFQTPAVLGEPIEGIGASFLVERSLEIGIAFQALEQHLRQALRVDRGLGYIVGTDYQPVSASQALAAVFVSCLPNSVGEVQRAVLEAIDDLAARGPTEDEIADHWEAAVRDLTDPSRNVSRLDARVRDALMGFETEPASVYLDRLWRLQPEQVAVAFRKARDSMLLVLPRTASRPQRPWRPYPGPTPGSMGNGQSFELNAKPKAKGMLRREKPPTLFVGVEGAMVQSGHAVRLAAVRWEDTVAILRDGPARTLLARDGSRLVLAPGDWKNGVYAIGLVDRWGPAAVVVPEGP
jgi:zinc protease